jgi:hypothetical protein
MVAAILFLLEIALGVGLYMTLAETDAAQRRIQGIQRQVDALSGRVDAVAGESKISHQRLVEDLWRRASDEVDREIEKGRARARGL